MEEFIIVAYFDCDSEHKILSNFAHTPFTLDGVEYASAEAFWQSLKTEEPMFRYTIQQMHGLNAKKAGKIVQGTNNLFTYQDNLYKVGSPAHHLIFERALRAKFEQNKDAKNALIKTGDIPLKHMFKNKFNQWRPGDSPALPAFVFEHMLMKIRTELKENNFISPQAIPIPKGINEF